MFFEIVSFKLDSPLATVFKNPLKTKENLSEDGSQEITSKDGSQEDTALQEGQGHAAKKFERERVVL